MRWIVLPLALAGCGFHEMRSTLPDVAVRAFDACDSYVRSRACGGYGAPTSTGCMSGIASQYARLPDTSARRAMLLESGCPSPVVDGVLARER